jgi:hypothetical protein
MWATIVMGYRTAAQVKKKKQTHLKPHNLLLCANSAVRGFTQLRQVLYLKRLECVRFIPSEKVAAGMQWRATYDSGRFRNRLRDRVSPDDAFSSRKGNFAGTCERRFADGVDQRVGTA